MSRGADDLPEPLSEEEKSYFQTVEVRFCALRGASMLLSPRDWALITSWWNERVPLSLVLESLEEVFATRVRRGDPAESIGSLAYARSEVQRRFRLHRELVGFRRGEEESTRLQREIRLHLGRMARRLAQVGDAARGRGQEEMARALIVGAAAIRELRRSAGKAGWNPSSAEERLEQIEAEILDSARAALGEGERKSLQARAREALSRRGLVMSEKAHQGTLRAVEDELLRRAWEIPRISFLAES